MNGTALARDAFDREYEQLIERYRKAAHELSPAARERLKNSVVSGMVEKEFFRQQAEKLGVVVSREEAEKEWAAHNTRYGPAAKVPADGAGAIPNDLRPLVEANLLREKVLAKIAEAATVNPEEVKAYYERNQARFVDREQIRLSAITIKVPPNSSPEEKAAKRQRAEAVLQKAKLKNADFAKLAAEYDEGRAKDRGGDVGFVVRGQLWKPLADVVWPLKVGEVRLVDTPAGFQVVEKTKQKAPQQKTFDEMKEQIERTLRLQKRDEVLRKSKSEAKIEILVKGDESIIGADRPTSRPPAMSSPTEKNRQQGAS